MRCKEFRDIGSQRAVFSFEQVCDRFHLVRCWRNVSLFGPHDSCSCINLSVLIGSGAMFAPINASVPHKTCIALDLWACGCFFALLRASPGRPWRGAGAGAASRIVSRWHNRLKPHVPDWAAFMGACLAMAVCSAVALLFFVPGPFLPGLWVFLRGGVFCGHVCEQRGDCRTSTPLPACGY
jgi:hypothetical protein